MLGAYSYGNNVSTTLNTGISDSAATVLLDEATAPFNDPPTDASATKPARFTLMDDPAAPNVIEIIQATGVSAPVAGVVTLTGVTRGLEGTTAQAWGGGTAVLQTVTQAMLNPVEVYSLAPFSYVGPFGGQAVTIERAVSFAGYTLLRVDTSDPGALFASFNALQCETGVFSNTLACSSLDVQTTLTVGGNITANLATVGVGGLRITQGAPATSSDTGLTGQIKVDANYLYVCTASNTWKRVALSSF